MTADRAKQIKTVATVNEDPTDALIRELKEQNERLKAQLATGVVTDDDVKDFGGDNSELSAAGKDCIALRAEDGPMGVLSYCIFFPFRTGGFEEGVDGRNEGNDGGQRQRDGGDGQDLRAKVEGGPREGRQ